MNNNTGAPLLFVAHPCHELLLHGWIARAKPVVHVLTDGSGHSSSSRIDMTAQFLREIGAQPGSIFGRLTDREAYAAILDANSPLLLGLANELADNNPSMVVCDAVEGYNPVHDLCRLIAGAAIALAGSDVPQYEYSVVNDPRSFEGMSDTISLDLDDHSHAAKLARARDMAEVVPDVDELIARYGAAGYRRETLRRVTDWTDIGSGDAQYETLGEQRVAGHRYERVIRRAEHIAPLRDALQRTCVS